MLCVLLMFSDICPSGPMATGITASVSCGRLLLGVEHHLPKQITSARKASAERLSRDFLLEARWFSQQALVGVSFLVFPHFRD